MRAGLATFRCKTRTIKVAEGFRLRHAFLFALAASCAAFATPGAPRAATPQPPRRPDQFRPASPSSQSPQDPSSKPPQAEPSGRAPVDVDVDKLQPYNLPPASREKMRQCGEEWRKLKMEGKSAGLIWRGFAEKCLTR